jgi:hypothetical protein
MIRDDRPHLAQQTIVPQHPPIFKLVDRIAPGILVDSNHPHGINPFSPDQRKAPITWSGFTDRSGFILR